MDATALMLVVTSPLCAAIIAAALLLGRDVRAIERAIRSQAKELDEDGPHDAGEAGDRNEGNASKPV